jgi:hypothetical protein
VLAIDVAPIVITLLATADRLPVVTLLSKVPTQIYISNGACIVPVSVPEAKV